MRVPLIGGAYAARSIIANAQRCVNYFPEVNTKDAPVPVTHYQRPGLKSLASAPVAGAGRGIWRASNGVGYCVIGQNVYQISSKWGLALLGSLQVAGTNLCSFVDNGHAAGNGFLVDGSTIGYSIDLGTGAFSQIVDGTGTFLGSTKVDFIDTFFLFNFPGTNQFGSTHSNSLVFDPLYVAAKTDWPDDLISLIVNRHEILLLGDVKSEVWYDAGNPLFPFAELPGAYIEHGCSAKYSVASSDISVFWLGQDLQGQGVVFRYRGYQTTRISNHALEVAIRQMAASVGISDATAYTYQQDGHYFYVLTFPGGDQTWVFDEATNEWHQRAWTDGNGVLHRERPSAHAFLYGENVVQDWETGDLYSLDLDTYTDTVSGTAGPISFIRSFPHILRARSAGSVIGSGQLEDWNGRRISYEAFKADLECGMANQSAQIGLRWSNDRGRTWGNTVLQTAGSLGQYLTDPQWRLLGIARDIVFEVSHSIDGPAALNGAWVEATVMET